MTTLCATQGVQHRCSFAGGLASADVQRLLSEPAPEGAPALECCVCLQEIRPSSPSLRDLEPI